MLVIGAYPRGHGELPCGLRVAHVDAVLPRVAGVLRILGLLKVLEAAVVALPVPRRLEQAPRAAVANTDVCMPTKSVRGRAGAGCRRPCQGPGS
eukprot:540692-Prorocentrum_minimum.AAC.1